MMEQKQPPDLGLNNPDLTNFKHQLKVNVRFNDVDMLGVCNNAVYITFFEEARLDYIKTIGAIPENGWFADKYLNFIVRNEINYRSHSFFNEELTVFTRISYLRNSSFGFDHVIVKSSTGEVVCDGKGVICFVDKISRKSVEMPDYFRSKVLSYENQVTQTNRETL